MARFVWLALQVKRDAFRDPTVVLTLFSSEACLAALRRHRALHLALSRLLPELPSRRLDGNRGLDIDGYSREEGFQATMEEYWVRYQAVFGILPLVSR